MLVRVVPIALSFTIVSIAPVTIQQAALDYWYRCFSPLLLATFSIGYPLFPIDDADSDGLLSRADIALGLARTAGRDRTIAAGAVSKADPGPVGAA